MNETSSNRPYAIFSSDGHAGADLMDYKPYLEKRWHEEFEDWAKTYSDAWGDIDTESEYRAGVSSFASPLNWDSTKRQEVLEGEGIVAEVLFPNTTPPFFPNGLLSAPGPLNRDEYEHRWAGLKAHNRWTADFCSMLPGRRFGVAQLFIDDLRENWPGYQIWSVDEAAEQVAAGRPLSLVPLCGGIPPEVAWPYLERAATVAATVPTPG